MKRPRRTDMRRRLLLQAGAAACALPAWAQSPWPAGPVRFIVPFPSGSAPDVMARLLGAKLSERWGKVAIVDNKPGASGVIGMSALKAAPADGHTFGFVQGSAITTAPATIKGVGYDYASDFLPVTLVSNAPFMLAVAADAPWQTLDELLKAARAKPESVEVADNGAATAPHLAAALLGQAAGVKFLHVHYQGGQQALQGLLSGQVKMQVETYNVLAPLVQGGRVRILASMSDRADPGLEALPLAQKAAPGAVAYGWFAVIARKGTEPRVVEQLNRELRAQLEAPDVMARFRELGAYPRPTTPAELDTFVAADRSKWLALIDRLGLKPE